LFFDALEKRDVAGVWSIVAWLPVLVAVSALTLSALVISRMLLQVRWREYLTRRLAGWWIADQRYYRLQFTAKEQSAPEYPHRRGWPSRDRAPRRIRDRADQRCVTAATFAAILWHVAGSARFTSRATTS
jgi:putative ATP-binding cassette transporter